MYILQNGFHDKFDKCVNNKTVECVILKFWSVLLHIDRNIIGILIELRVVWRESQKKEGDQNYTRQPHNIKEIFVPKYSCVCWV